MNENCARISTRDQSIDSMFLYYICGGSGTLVEAVRQAGAYT